MLDLKIIKNISLKDKTPLIEGKSKKIYRITDEIYFMFLKPHLRSITSKREENIPGTDIERLYANLYYMNLMAKNGIPTQLLFDEIVTIDGLEGLLVKKIKTIPIEFICRYYAEGSIVRQYPSIITKGQKFKRPLYKFDLKQDISVAGIDDPTLNENYIVGLELLTEKNFQTAKSMLAKIGDIINNDFISKGVKFIDMKMEFGFDEDMNIVLIDEISQDCIRANDMETGDSLTKDSFRNMKTDEEVLNIYKEFNRRIVGKE